MGKVEKFINKYWRYIKNACYESLNQKDGKILPRCLDHFFIISLFISEKMVNIICHNSLKEYALRYKRQNKLLYQKIIDHKNDDYMLTVEDYLSCSVVCTYIRYTVGKCILNITQIQELEYICKQGT